VVKGNALIVTGSDLVDFGEVPVGFRISRNLQVLNSGQSELTIEAFRIESDNEVFEVEMEPMQLPFQSDVMVPIFFWPNEAGTFEGTLTIVSDASNTDALEVRLKGVGIEEVICGDCTSPPEDRCLNENDLVVYDQEGYCEDDQCRYVATHITCPWGCDADTATCFPECQGEDCPSVDAGPEPMPEPVDAGSPNEIEPADAGPPPVSPEGEIIDVAVGRYTSCALRTNGKVYCWGSNGEGKLGIGLPSTGTPNPMSLGPAMLPENDPVTDIQMGSKGAMARLASGKLYCWGSCMKTTPNSTSLISQYTPTLVAGVSDIDYFEMAHWQACGMQTNGDVICWGRNTNAALGNGNENLVGSYEHTNLGNITHLGTGYYMSGGGHTCALADNNDVWCWGFNQRGQAGQTNGDVCGDGDCVKSPQKVAGLEGKTLVYLDASNASSCVVTEEGEVYCWGQNTSGQLGNGTYTSTGEPQRVQGLGGVRITEVSLGSGHICALSEDGEVYCWGSNTRWNQVGDSTDVNQLQAVQVPGLPLPAIQVAARTEHTCALLEDQNVWCWGANTKGQVGIMPEEGEICSPPSNYCSVPRRVQFPWE
tara:strand:- start:971 stop:2746 length:1776 start_codon:yes stop_codon:yes gene_type:complete